MQNIYQESAAAVTEEEERAEKTKTIGKHKSSMFNCWAITIMHRKENNVYLLEIYK